MKLLNNFHAYTTYRKILISYILVVIVSVTLISGVLFQLFSNSSALEINQISQVMLSQTSYTSDVIYEQTLSVANQLLSDTEIISAMYFDQRDYTVEYTVAQKLSYIKNVYPFINSIGVYNGIIDLYTDNLRSNYEELTNLKQLILKGTNAQNFTFLPRKINYPLNNNGTIKDVLTFILYPSISHSLPDKGAIVINIDGAYLQNTMQKMHSNKEDTIFILNDLGIVVSHSSKDLFMSDFSQTSYCKKISENKNNTGYLIETVNGQKQLITFVRSKKLNWTFISLRPYSALLSNINHLRNITLIISLVLILLGIAFSILLTRNIYNPISVFMDKITSSGRYKHILSNKRNEFDFLSDAFSETLSKANLLEASIGKAYPALKETYYDFLLKGKADELFDSINFVKGIEDNLVGPYFCIILFKIDAYEDFKQENSVQDQGLLRFAISNIAQELLEKQWKNDLITMNDDQVLLLAQLNDASEQQTVFPILHEIRDTLEYYFKFSITISLGDIVSTRKEIKISYDTALKYAQYRFFHGHGSILNFDKVKEQINKTDKYDYTYEKKLVGAIQLNNPDKLENMIQSFVGDIKLMSLNNVQLYTNQLMISVLRQLNNMLDLQESEYQYYYKQARISSTFETLENLTEHLRTFCNKICEKLENISGNKNLLVVEQAKEYIQNHFAEADLSIDVFASTVHLSAGYLGTMFKNFANVSFNDYLNTIRLDKAQYLLMNTDDPITIISEKVGIYNNTYFFTLFKKAYGMTPSQYRSKHKQ
ncbi:MAG TPA: helix-turn-helix domain-containing protein [Ruminiclostridium sp.]